MGGAEGRAGRGWAGPFPARRKAAPRLVLAGSGRTDESAGRCASWTSQPRGQRGGVGVGKDFGQREEERKQKKPRPRPRGGEGVEGVVDPPL